MSDDSVTPSHVGWRPVGRLLMRYAWPYRASYGAGAVFLLLTNYLTVLIPLRIGVAVDELAIGGEVARHAWAIAAMGAAIIVVRAASRVFFFNPGRDLEYHLRLDLFDHLLELQPSFYSKRSSGDIISRASADIQLVRAMIGFGGLQAVNVVMAFSLSAWKMVELSPSLSLWVLAPVLGCLAVAQIGIRKLFGMQRQVQEELAAMSEHVLGSLQGIASIQGFAAEKAFEDRFEAKGHAWLVTSLRLALIRSLALPIMAVGAGLAVWTLLWFGGRMALAGELSVGQLLAFIALVMTMVPPLRSLGWMLAVMQRGRAAVERILELLDEPVERPEGENPTPMRAGAGPQLRLIDLDYSYPGSDDVALEGIDVTIDAGSVVGIVGRTGSGKSTLLSLLARLGNPPAGSVLVDGVDLTTVELAAWRERIVLVPQRPYLFSRSIRDNVRLGDDGAVDEARVIAAVEAAALGHDLDALPEGIDTMVGQRGVMLSGGQRQRAALARGLYRSADLLMLDDVLSAVDQDTESRLVGTIRELARRPNGPTVIIAGHRLSAVREADQILVLDHGRLVDAGPHQLLVERCELYREAWEHELQRAADEELAV